jgi:hypothetical protein
MAGPGIPVDETLTWHGSGLAEATARLRTSVGDTYRIVDLGAGRLQLVRGVRPRWALVLGIVTAPTLVGLLFLLVRSPESWTAAFAEDHRGVRIRIEGVINPAVLRALRATFVLPADPVLDVAAAGPVLGAGGGRATPPPRPAPSTLGRGGAPTPRPPIGVLLRFDDGGVITAGAAMFIGRDPIAPPGEAPAMLVPVADPDRSVSKTHLTVRAHPDGVVVTDRGSVNGTTVESPTGQVSNLRAGEAALVPLGSTVRFGSRSFVVSGGLA